MNHPSDTSPTSAVRKRNIAPNPHLNPIPFPLCQRTSSQALLCVALRSVARKSSSTARSNPNPLHSPTRNQNQKSPTSAATSSLSFPRPSIYHPPYPIPGVWEHNPKHPGCYPRTNQPLTHHPSRNAQPGAHTTHHRHRTNMAQTQHRTTLTRMRPSTRGPLRLIVV